MRKPAPPSRPAQPKPAVRQDGGRPWAPRPAPPGATPSTVVQDCPACLLPAPYHLPRPSPAYRHEQCWLCGWPVAADETPGPSLPRASVFTASNVRTD